MKCAACGDSLVERVVAGEAMRACTACAAMLVSRAAVARLRERRKALGLDAPGAPATVPSASVPRTCTCPACGRPMLGFAYGGGNTRVEACDACDHLFFDRGELHAVLEEARSGVAMDDDARAALHEHRVLATQQRSWNAELGVAAAGLLAVYFALRFTLSFGPTTIVVIGAATVALTGYIFYRRRAVREQRDAEARLDRLMAAESWRLDEAKRVPSGSKVAARTSRSCPFCSAALPAGSTHCSACDSDFG